MRVTSRKKTIDTKNCNWAFVSCLGLESCCAQTCRPTQAYSRAGAAVRGQRQGSGGVLHVSLVCDFCHFHISLVKHTRRRHRRRTRPEPNPQNLNGLVIPRRPCNSHSSHTEIGHCSCRYALSQNIHSKRADCRKARSISSHTAGVAPAASSSSAATARTFFLGGYREI